MSGSRWTRRWIAWRRWISGPLCFFTGLTQEQAAKQLGISLRTAERLWAFAQAWLLREVKKAMAREA